MKRFTLELIASLLSKNGFVRNHRLLCIPSEVFLSQEIKNMPRRIALNERLGKQKCTPIFFLPKVLLDGGKIGRCYMPKNPIQLIHVFLPHP